MSAHIRRYASRDLDRCRELWVELTQHHRDIYGDPSIGGVDPGSFLTSILPVLARSVSGLWRSMARLLDW